MAAAKNERSGAVKRVEQGERLRAGRRDKDRRDQEQCGEQGKRYDACLLTHREIQMPGNQRDVSPTKPKASASPERDRCDLAERSGEERDDRNRGKRDADTGAIGSEDSRQAPDSLCDDRDGAARLTYLFDGLDGSYLHGGKRIGDASPFDVVWFEDAKRDKVAAYLGSGEAKAFLPALEATAELIDGFESPLGMELLATIDWLVQKTASPPIEIRSRLRLRNGQAARNRRSES
jgi:hypothetical protein